MVKKGLLTEPLFAIWLDPNKDSVPAGSISFGGTNPTKYTGSISYFPGSTIQDHW